ncbi:hypothetical protein EAE99_007127 [Botrytis elliptica]|nr:hypothetical protein EAE99_007127 [Botrytis elliptica]
MHQADYRYVTVTALNDSLSNCPKSFPKPQAQAQAQLQPQPQYPTPIPTPTSIPPSNLFPSPLCLKNSHPKYHSTLTLTPQHPSTQASQHHIATHPILAILANLAIPRTPQPRQAGTPICLEAAKP